VKDLYGHAGKRDPSTGEWVAVRGAAVSSLLFALDTDLAIDGLTEAVRYKNLVQPNHTWISGICIAGRVSWFPTEMIVYDKDSGMVVKPDDTPIRGDWREVRADADCAEVLAFLTTVTQLVQAIGPLRGQPPLDAYFNPTAEEARRKVRITSGPQRSFFVGLDRNRRDVKVQLHNIPYSFYQDEGEAFEFWSNKASEMRAALTDLDVESELV
jgi:hypothetical protein